MNHPESKSIEPLTLCEFKTNTNLTFSIPKIEVGRNREYGLCLNQPGISRSHALFTFENGNWYIMDCGSTNGTRLNGIKLHPDTKYYLKNQDKIKFPGKNNLYIFIKPDHDNQSVGSTTEDLEILPNMQTYPNGTTDTFVSKNSPPDNNIPYNICKNCGANVEKSYAFCVSCGTKMTADPEPKAPSASQSNNTVQHYVAPADDELQYNICSNCGAKINRNFSFCTNCGTEMAVHDQPKDRPAVQDQNDNVIKVYKNMSYAKGEVTKMTLKNKQATFVFKEDCLEIYFMSAAKYAVSFGLAGAFGGAVANSIQANNIAAGTSKKKPGIVIPYTSIVKYIPSHVVKNQTIIIYLNDGSIYTLYLGVERNRQEALSILNQYRVDFEKNDQFDAIQAGENVTQVL